MALALALAHPMMPSPDGFGCQTDAWPALYAHWMLWEFQRRFIVLDGLWKSLARRAYTIFIIHPSVLVAVALAWRGVSANALVKFAVTGTVSCALCFFFAGWLLRVPVLRKIL